MHKIVGPSHFTFILKALVQRQVDHDNTHMQQQQNENPSKHENPDFRPLSMMPLGCRWHCWMRWDTLHNKQSTPLEFAHRQGYSGPDEDDASW
jgi:hypothetical protein